MQRLPPRLCCDIKTLSSKSCIVTVVTLWHLAEWKLKRLPWIGSGGASKHKELLWQVRQLLVDFSMGQQELSTLSDNRANIITGMWKIFHTVALNIFIKFCSNSQGNAWVGFHFSSLFRSHSKSLWSRQKGFLAGEFYPRHKISVFQPKVVSLAMQVELH